MALAKSASGLWIAIILLVGASMVTVVRGTSYECSEGVYDSSRKTTGGESLLTKNTDSLLDCLTRCFQHANEYTGEKSAPWACRVVDYNTERKFCRLVGGSGYDSDEERQKTLSEISMEVTEDFNDKVAICRAAKIDGTSCGSVDNCLNLPEKVEVEG